MLSLTLECFNRFNWFLFCFFFSLSEYLFTINKCIDFLFVSYFHLSLILSCMFINILLKWLEYFLEFLQSFKHFRVLIFLNDLLYHLYSAINSGFFQSWISLFLKFLIGFSIFKLFLFLKFFLMLFNGLFSCFIIN